MLLTSISIDICDMPYRIGETDMNLESELDWGAIAKNWKSVRSPQWLRSKWWSLKRQVPGYEALPISSKSTSTVHINKKVYTFKKSPHINISKYFQEISIHVGSYGSLLSNDTKKFDDIVCLSEQEPHL